MIDTTFPGKLKNGSFGSKKLKDEEGNIEEIAMKSVKILSELIDAEDFAKTFPEANSHITAMEPCQMKNGTFEVNEIPNLCLKFRTVDSTDYENEMEFLTLTHCELTKLSFKKTKEGMIEYAFQIEFPVLDNVNNAYVDQIANLPAEFEFFQQSEF